MYFTYISTPSFSLDRTSSRLVLLQATRRQRTTIDPTSPSSSSSCQRTEATSARDQRPSHSSPQCSSPQTTSGTDKTPTTSSLWSGRACWAALLIPIHHYHRASVDNPAILVVRNGWWDWLSWRRGPQHCNAAPTCQESAFGATWLTR